jgi:hypothetical protein
MEGLLADLGVVHADESGEQRRVQDLVEEAQEAAAALAQKNAASGPPSGRTKRSVLEEIMDGANAANEPRLVGTPKVHTQHKQYKREERVRFLDKMDDIPKTNEREGSYHHRGGKRGHVNPATSLNLFSTRQSSDYDYKSNTSVDTSTIQSIMSDAKRQRLTQTDDHIPEVTSFATTYSDAEDQDHVVETVALTEDTSLAGVDTVEAADCIICPFCSRSLQYLMTDRRGPTLVEQHIDRCSRRGGRPSASYMEAGEEDQSEPHLNSRRETGRRKSQPVATRKVVAPTENDSAEGEELVDSDWEAENAEVVQANERAGRGKGSASTYGSARRTRSAGRSPVVTVSSTAASDADDAEASSNEWEGFVPSIVDDWEDSAYLERLERLRADREGHLQRKQDRAGRRKQNTTAVAGSNDADREGLDSEFVRTDYGTEVLRRTWDSLHEYQREGCRWLHRLYDEGVGGILGDEMGKFDTGEM